MNGYTCFRIAGWGKATVGIARDSRGEKDEKRDGRAGREVDEGGGYAAGYDQQVPRREKGSISSDSAAGDR